MDVLCACSNENLIIYIVSVYYNIIVSADKLVIFFLFLKSLFCCKISKHSQWPWLRSSVAWEYRILAVVSSILIQGVGHLLISFRRSIIWNGDSFTILKFFRSIEIIFIWFLLRKKLYNRKMQGETTNTIGLLFLYIHISERKFCAVR